MATPQVMLPIIDPQVIARAFVDQYYRILHKSPDQVYRFYQERSILSRPDVNGTMTSATTLEGINEKIMSMDVSNYFWEIDSADAQPSYMNGVFIVVTGSLAGPDRIRRPFAQSFFLAPQDTNGYFVLNDVLRIAIDRTGVVPQAVNLVPVIANGSIHVPNGGAIPLQANVVVPVQANGVIPLQSNDNAPVPSKDAVSVPANGTVGEETTPEPEPADQEVNHTSEPLKEDQVVSVHLSNGDVNVRERAMNGFVNGGLDKRGIMCNGVAPTNVNKEEAKKKQHAEETVPSPQQDAPKRSYALIVMKGSPVSKPVEVAVKNPKVVEKVEKPAPTPAPPKQAPAQEAAVASETNDSVNKSNEVQGYSIFVKNLPVHVKADQLEEAYKNFGAIKPGGVQVRMSRFDHYWFGFVEFESPESMQAAIEAQPVTINDRQVFCEEKRSSSRVNGMHVRGENGNGNNGNGPRGPPMRNNSGYRNENYRGGRAPPVRGRGQRPMSGPMRPRDGYHHQQRSYQNSNGRPPTGLEGPSETPVAA